MDDIQEAKINENMANTNNVDDLEYKLRKTGYIRSK
jgi:hypothetical protein